MDKRPCHRMAGGKQAHPLGCWLWCAHHGGNDIAGDQHWDLLRHGSNIADHDSLDEVENDHDNGQVKTILEFALFGDRFTQAIIEMVVLIHRPVRSMGHDIRHERRAGAVIQATDTYPHIGIGVGEMIETVCRWKALNSVALTWSVISIRLLWVDWKVVA